MPKLTISFFTCLFVLGLLLLPITVAAAVDSEPESDCLATVQTVSGNLNVRAGAGLQFDILAKLPKGTQVIIISEDSGWSKIFYDGTKTGFVSSSFLVKKGEQSAAPVPISLTLENFKQYDSQWAYQRVGKSAYTMKGIGCTTCCLAMAESYRTSSVVLPGTLAAAMQYTSGGALYWPDNYVFSIDCSTYLATIYSQLALEKPVIVSAKTSSGGAHWVIVTGYTGNGSLYPADFSIHDPGSSWRTNLQHLFNDYPYFYKIVYYQ